MFGRFLLRKFEDNFDNVNSNRRNFLKERSSSCQEAWIRRHDTADGNKKSLGSARAAREAKYFDHSKMMDDRVDYVG